MREERNDECYCPTMPPCDAPYLIACLFDVGPALAGGFGPMPVSEQELAAWQSNTGVTLSPWESRLLKTLSRAHIVESKRAEKVDCPAPWQEIEEEDRFAVAKRIKSMFRE